MNKIALVRIDDRLIHTLVLLTWIKHYNINCIYIVDNELEKDSFMTQVYKLSIPSHIQLKIFNDENLPLDLATYQEDPTQKKIILVIMRSLITAVHLLERGVSLSEFQIGNEFLLGKKISLKEPKKYEKQLKSYIDSGFVFYFQQSPDSPKTTLKKEQLE